MSKNAILSLSLVAIVPIILVALMVLTGPDRPEPEGLTGESVPIELLVREDSPRLSDGEEAVFVEFLDFECESCIALYPVIEDLRAEYGDRVTFVVRHMPLHANSVNAALAAEAAGEQGQFEQMYQKLFETDHEWGHQSSSQKDTFFGYAEDLGLDMDRFRKDVDDPATLARIEQSQHDAQSVGVTGTPTFFLDGQRLDPVSVSDLHASVEAVLND
ncbi:thioredoxin domain-containing protein [Corynebacterium testudinoris]|uniref:Protein-disulfide isomerase n=1 Tax=Corynebacterium testudinoris TaxID=136857 RepID=A0A0G3H886_9CORY|nr:thioredoxin domain-containing protein [Corynebacterium testudinoris]AKK08048.1 protein-disulfide isomerase [Corynebacterium testudinoris]MBX8996839.1 thioredoxin domain-containing protein [Corynebacterium testudinoris]